MKKVLMALIIGTLVSTLVHSVAFAQTTSSTYFKDLGNHWAKVEITKALNQGWVNGYGDNTFRPDNTISRAEFIKMLEASIGLTKDSETSKFLIRATEKYRSEQRLTGIDKHWLQKQGWIEPALAYGLIVPSDYTSNNLVPDTAITRREIVVMLDRAMGLVSASEKEKGIDLQFADQKDIPAWVKGYIHQSVTAGLIKGYPDGTFRQGRKATRAEALVMINHLQERMNQGTEQNYQVMVNGSKADLSTPVQIIEDQAYLPVRDILYTANPNLNMSWNPIKQYLSFYWEMDHVLRPDSLTYEFNGVYSWDFPAKSRMVNGELMYPIGNYFSDNDTFYLGNLWGAKWDNVNKIIEITLNTPLRPNPS